MQRFTEIDARKVPLVVCNRNAGGNPFVIGCIEHANMDLAQTKHFTKRSIMKPHLTNDNIVPYDWRRNFQSVDAFSQQTSRYRDMFFAPIRARVEGGYPFSVKRNCPRIIDISLHPFQRSLVRRGNGIKGEQIRTFGFRLCTRFSPFRCEGIPDVYKRIKDHQWLLFKPGKQGHHQQCRNQANFYKRFNKDHGSPFLYRGFTLL